MDHPERSKANPWQPITDPLTIKILGKLAEELGECGAATMRCLIQGVNEAEPDTGKLNRNWLEDELADVMANAVLVARHLTLDAERIERRKDAKIAFLQTWHDMKENPDAQ